MFLLYSAIGGLVALALLARNDSQSPEGVDDMSSFIQGVGYYKGAPYTITLGPIGNGFYLRADAAEAYNKMMQACFDSTGFGTAPVSAYRTMEEQTRLYGLYESGEGNHAARPGYSDHQDGRSVDEKFINPNRAGYRKVKDTWLVEHCGEYGFRRDGLSFGEPWHMTYFG